MTIGAIMKAVRCKEMSTTKRSSPDSALRCVVYGVDGHTWRAECIDLDLMVEGPTSDETVASLRDAMAGYLTTAFEGDTSGLVPRPSPLGHRVRYHLFCLKAALTANRRDFRIMDCSADQLPLCA